MKRLQKGTSAERFSSVQPKVQRGVFGLAPAPVAQHPIVSTSFPSIWDPSRICTWRPFPPARNPCVRVSRPPLVAWNPNVTTPWRRYPSFHNWTRWPDADDNTLRAGNTCTDCDQASDSESEPFFRMHHISPIQIPGYVPMHFRRTNPLRVRTRIAIRV